MPLTLYKRPSGIYHIRGTHHGVRVDQSARTDSKADAHAVKDALARQIFDEVIHGKKRERTFAEAAYGYLRGGGEGKYMNAIARANITLDGQRFAFATLPLSRVTQDAIDVLALELYAEAKPSTRIRHVYSPVSAVMNWAADAWPDAPRRRIRRPKQPPGRTDWRTPEEIERWLEKAGHLAPILTAYVGSGARASELVGLEWPSVLPGETRIVLWGDETKGAYTRHVDLQSRVRATWPQRGDGVVFRNKRGEPWHAYDAINLGLRRLAEKHDLPALHLHVLRHTWATWAYAVTKDLTHLMGQGGWRSEKMALRYIHTGTDELAREVEKFGWEMRRAA